MNSIAKMVSRSVRSPLIQTVLLVRLQIPSTRTVCYKRKLHVHFIDTQNLLRLLESQSKSEPRQNNKKPVA